MDSKFAIGLAAGLAATLVLTVIMLMKSTMEVMPELDVIGMLASMMGGLAWLAWLVHFMIGAMWGIIFAYIHGSIPGDSYWLKGAIFLIGPWLIMMVVLMPMAGQGFFGLELGMMAIMATFVLHLLFGAVMGGVYGWHTRKSSMTAAA